MYTPIELDKVRNIRFGMKAISLIEKKLKKPMSKIDFDNVTMEDLAVIIWSGLVHEDRDLTPDRVMDLIDEFSTINETLEVVMKAFNDSLGANKQSDISNEIKN